MLPATVSTFLISLGKGPGFILVALGEVLVGGVCAYLGKDLIGLSAVFGTINVPLYGAGVWKASSDNAAATAQVVRDNAKT